MSYQFDFKDEEVLEDFSKVIEPGVYLAVISRISLGKDKNLIPVSSKKGACMYITFTIQSDGKFKDYEHSEQYILEHENAVPVRIAKEAIAKLRKAAEMDNNSNPEALLHKAVKIKLKVEEGQDGTPRNKIVEYLNQKEPSVAPSAPVGLDDEIPF